MIGPPRTHHTTLFVICLIVKQTHLTSAAFGFIGKLQFCRVRRGFAHFNQGGRVQLRGTADGAGDGGEADQRASTSRPCRHELTHMGWRSTRGGENKPSAGQITTNRIWFHV